jgi:hypothetical protein
VSAALDTLARFEALGIAVFPGYCGRKGTYVKGWSTMPATEAWQRTREDLRRNVSLNLAARTGQAEDGSFYAVFDNDQHYPEASLGLFQEAYGDSLIAVVRTGPHHDGHPGRGLHIWVRVSEPVLNGHSPKGDIFCVNNLGRGHLANLPPSRHPSGITYEWITL